MPPQSLYGHPVHELLATFTAEFATCRTTDEMTRVHRLLWERYVQQDYATPKVQVPFLGSKAEALSDAARRGHTRLVDEREHRATRSTLGRGDHVRSHTLRNWCRREGIPLAPHGRVPTHVENLYRSAHEMPLLGSKRAKTPGLPVGVDTATVRSWARANGVEVGKRGRVAPIVITQYLEANS